MGLVYSNCTKEESKYTRCLYFDVLLYFMGKHILSYILMFFNNCLLIIFLFTYLVK